MLEKKEKKQRRHKRIKAKIFGTVKRPRLFVFRTPKHIYAQLIDDEKGKTLLALSDLKMKKKEIKDKSAKVGLAYQLGQLIAKEAIKKKINQVVFDRGGSKYHGRIKAVADGAREAGLKF